MTSSSPVICSAGEGALLIRFGTGIDLDVSEAVLGCLSRLDNAEREKKPEGITDIVPAYAALMVHFDPLRLHRNAVEEWVRSHLNTAESQKPPKPRQIEIPVQYGGEHGVDIEEVARMTSLGSAAEVARIHSKGEYRVYFLGFLGGFPYLGGLQAPLTSVPRLATPREKLLPGTVGIAGGQTGVYTVESPGGWHLLGKTTMTLFDPSQDPPAMLRAGDLIKFAPVEQAAGGASAEASPAERKRKAGENAEATAREAKRKAGAVGSEGPCFEILVPGPQTTVQDLSRPGYFRHGVGRAGAADDLALRMGNTLVGNAETDAGLEVLMGGLQLRFAASARQSAATIALTGADCAVKLVRPASSKGKGAAVVLGVNRTVELRAGDELHFGYAKDGMRSYLCVAGGVDVPLVLGSRSTDVRARMGGFEGRTLRAGDRLQLGTPSGSPLSSLTPRLARSTVHDPLRTRVTTGKSGETVWELRIVVGPGDPSVLSAQAREEASPLCLNGRRFSVLAKSDRMAACLSLAGSDSPDFEAEAPLRGAQQLTEPCVSGTVQLPPDGNPVILLAEHQTTGGYRVAGTVIKADLWRLGQMRPKDHVKFVQVGSEEEAVAALRQVRERWARETRPLALPLANTRLPSRMEDHTPEHYAYELISRRTASALKRIDLNADAGEGFDDETLLKYVTSVNIACGGHVGDAASMARTVALAVQAGAGIGAHVSFVDRKGFGRKRLDTPPAELFQQVLSQAGALISVCRAAGRKVRYMKPHGALYHAVMEGGEQGAAVWEAAQLLGLPMLLMPRSGWASFGEGFSERAYDGNGKQGPEQDDWFNLRAREKPGAVIHDPAEAAQQALRLAKQPRIHSICVHSDSPNAANVAKAVRQALENEYEMRPFCTPETDFSADADEGSEMQHEGTADADAAMKTAPSIDQSMPPAAPDAAEEGFPADLRRVLEQQVAPVLVRGYRTGEGCEPDLYPQARACEAVQRLLASLDSAEAEQTVYTKFAQGAATYEDFIADLRKQLARQGGGWVTVAPRDTCQQGSDSESAAITDLSRKNAQLYAVKAGCVGYETGGAQYQAALIRGFDPATVLQLGLPTNMPAHSLQRAQYVNGLAELAAPVRQALFQATAELVATHYRGNSKAVDPTVPWHPYNFHAGNFFDESSGYSPLDETTGELLDAQCCPMPCWVFSAKFSLQQLEQWTVRQIELWRARKRTLHCMRIKNPGQGKEWTAATVWAHCEVIIGVFAASTATPEPPIIYVHNHDMNGAGGHIGAELLRTAQAAGFSSLVVDAAFRKNGTHNDNTVVAAALELDEAQRAALAEYNRNQQAIEKLLCRFDSRTSQMTPWDSDWAGGTEGSDLRIAKQFNLDPQQIETAKRVASAVFPLERAVTPFSEYKLRLGIGIMIEPGITPKTPAAVRDWIFNKNGKLKVGGDVLLGLKRWETLVDKPKEVDKFLENMAEELTAALNAQTDASKRVVPTDVPAAKFSAAQRVTALGFQQKGLEFILSCAGTAKDLSPLLTAPHLLHRKPLSLPAGTTFQLLPHPAHIAARASAAFAGFAAQGEQVVLSFVQEREGGAKPLQLDVALADPEAALELQGRGSAGQRAAASGPGSVVRQADPSKFPLEFPCQVPGELLAVAVKVGQVLRSGQALCTVECMKMEMLIAVPAELDGKRVKSLGAQARTQTAKGDFLSPGDLLVEVE